MNHTPHRYTPSQAVLHPAWLTAVAVLVVNDHLLKSSEFAGVVTGKLSDFAGLFFFPVLLAAVLRVRTRRGLVLSGVATAAVFSALNLSAGFAARFDALASYIVPFHTTVDPTDLLALVAIPAGLLFFAPLMQPRARAARRRSTELFAIGVGCAASVATSPYDPECCGIDTPVYVTLLNKTNELHELKLRQLRPDVVFDCEEASAAPNDYFGEALFDPPSVVLLQSGQEIDVTNGVYPTNSSHCVVTLVTSPTVPDILVMYDMHELETRTYVFDADIPFNVPADQQTVVLEADYSDVRPEDMHEWRERSACGERADLCNPATLEPLATIPDGARYFWTSVHSERLHHEVPEPATPQEPTAECAVATRPSLQWGSTFDAELPFRDFVVGEDGCHSLLLGEEDATQTFSLCAPESTLARLTELGDTATISATSYRSSTYDTFELRVVEREPARMFSVWLVRGSELPEAVDFGPVITPIASCDNVEIACGQRARAGEVGSTNYDLTLRAGESSDNLPFDVHLVYAHHYTVASVLCSENAVSLSDTQRGYLEAVIVREY